MKTLSNFLCIIFLLTVSIHSQEPTDAGIPDANHVLVVWNGNATIYDSVMQYYVDARNIPSSNIVRLDLPDSIEINIEGVTHWVGIRQKTDIIRDLYQHYNNEPSPTRHAWRYYLDYVWQPIYSWISSHNLTSTIRYIVLVKGVPFKIQAAGDGSNLPGNLTVDGLLCMLNTPDYENFIMNKVYPTGEVPNPYYKVDTNFTMDYRFLPDHFTTTWQSSTVKLSYLVSHLDGISYEIVKGIIDRSIDPDMSGTATWVLDGDPTKGEIADLVNARDKLEDLGFNVVYDYTDDWITSYVGNVMGYASWGTHAEDGNCEWEDSAWVKDSLKFTLANGSVFNTYESFNGNSLTTLKWRYVARPNQNCHHTQGLATQFTEIGGTGTMGHAWEPGTIAQDAILFPAYQLGYSLVDAFYQSLDNIARQNVLVGDPLTRIYECENNVITSNTTIGSGDYQCNVIVPQNVVLTIASGSTINFSRNAALKVYGTLIVSESASLNFNGYSNLLLESTSSLVSLENTSLNFEDHSFMTVNSDVVFDGNTVYSFYDDSKITINTPSKIQGSFYLNLFDRSVCITHSSMILVQEAQLNLDGGGTFNNYGTMLLNSGSAFNINGSVEFYSSGVFKSLGNVNNYAAINFPIYSTTNQLNFTNIDTLQLSYTSINYGYISLNIDDGNQQPRLISITNSIVNSTYQKIVFKVTGTIGVNATLSDNRINCNNSAGHGIEISGFNNIQLLRDTIQNTGSGVLGEGIQIENNNFVEIMYCEILDFKDGIKQGHTLDEEIETANNREIYIYNCTINGIGFDLGSGISLEYDISQIPNTLEIEHNNFSEFGSGISINNASYTPVQIKYNIITNFKQFGISLAGGNDSVIKENNISSNVSAADNCVGIFLGESVDPKILSNTISAYGVTNPGVGIMSVSSNGEIRNNTIQFHLYGIELGSASPSVGANTITDNLYYGMYISSDSYPDLSEAFVGEEQYPLSGYNTIRENGLCNQLNYSELYLERSIVNLEKGCNTIADDREEQLSCGYLYLIDGEGTEIEIQAIHNYWGELSHSNPEGRFGEGMIVNYDDWLEDPCTYDQGETELILVNSKGEVYDTVYSTGITSSGLTDLETRYASANNYYYNNHFNQANQEYQGIIQSYGNSKESLQAYNRLYTIANLTNSSPASFAELKDFYLQKASNQSDSIMIGTLTHLGDLCLVSAAEYIPAINNFDQIAQQNPNTDVALYRQIDALTTALLMPQDSSLNKGVLGKYSVSDLTEYNNKLSDLLKTRGKSGLNSEKELLPTEYTLYQNYPNPFNPTTTIKYDLPFASDVSLTIYDILGRKAKELVNTKQQAGRYEVTFDASNLASGVYIYQLIAENTSTSSGQGFISSKKMILLR